MSDVAQYASTVAAEILAQLYVIHPHQPEDLATSVTELFEPVANRFGVPTAQQDRLLRLTHETVESFVTKTSWHEYHADLTGPHAGLIDAPVMLTQRLARLT